jgi:hypothetical protein
VASAAWPLIAAWRTGRADAYTATMRAWRGGKDIELFSPWWRYAQYLLGDVTGPAVLLLVLLAFLAWVLSPAGRVVAGDLRAWCLCYVAYLLVVVDPVTSVVRYLLLLFPLGAMVAAASPSRAYRLALTAAFLAGQVVWVVYLWRFLPPVDWPP